jgi:membrane associated rhomboid family serine protease
MFQLTPVVRNILIVNLLVFFLPQTLGTSDLITKIFGLHHIDSPYFMPWQWLTHAFVHANFQHILFNMLGMVFFGPILESVWGSKRFILFYLVCAVGAGLLYNAINYYELAQEIKAAEAFYLNPNPTDYELFIKKFHPEYLRSASGFANQWENNLASQYHIMQSKEDIDNLIILNRNQPMIGASGAIYGILAAFGLLFPNMELVLIFPPIPIKAWIMISIYFVTSLYSAINPMPGDNVAHYAHLGGMFIGAIFVYFWRTGNTRTY